MPSGYHIGVTDLDSIFASLQGGMTPAAATGYQVAGVDLNARYAPLTYGSAAGPTGYKSAGSDLNAIFAAFGSTNIVFTTQPSNVSGTAAAGAPSGTVTSSSPMTVSVSGGHPPYTYTWNVSGGATALSPNSPTTFISSTVNADFTLSGTAYCNVQDSTGRSVNSNLANYSLTNTSQNQVNFSFRAQLYTDSSGSSIGYQSPSFYGTSGVRPPATPEPIVSFSGGDQVVSILWSGATGDLFFTVYALNATTLNQSWLQNLTIAGVTLTGASAAFMHSPSPLYAMWSWSVLPQPFIAGTTYAGDFIYNP